MERLSLSTILEQGAAFTQGFTKGHRAAMAFQGGPALAQEHSAKRRIRKAYMDGVLTGISLALAGPPSGPTEERTRIIYEGVRSALSLHLYPMEPDNTFPGGKIMGVFNSSNA